MQAWSAEGLLYYLEPSTVGPMLKVRQGSTGSHMLHCIGCCVT